MRKVWHPPAELVQKSNVKKFMDKHGIRDYKELIKRSTDDIEWFWNAANEALKISWFKKYDTVVSDVKSPVEKPLCPFNPL